MDKKLKEKYNVYEEDYKYYLELKKIEPECSPELIDAFFSGCRLPLVKASRKNFDSEVCDDIKEIIKQNPFTINCNVGYMRCRNRVTPLAAACHNTSVPISMIEFLLDNGANPDLPIDLINKRILIIDDLKDNLDEERYEKIRNIFDKYRSMNIKSVRKY